MNTDKRTDKHTDKPSRRARRLRGTGTVEWVMLITVALVVLTAIYYFAQWAMSQTASSVKKVEGTDK